LFDDSDDEGEMSPSVDEPAPPRSTLSSLPSLREAAAHPVPKRG
jgi:hypothetical protein